MKFIKLIFISIFFLFLVATCIGLLFPATVVVSRVVDISAPKDSIYTLIKDVNGWKKWIDGLNDTTVIMTTPLKANLGNTTVTITQTNNENRVINSDWETKNNGNQEGTMEIFQQKGQMTAAVHWQFVQHIGWYPWERFASMMNDKIMGTMMEKNLNNLKTKVEAY